jgi:hypothetical protein
MMQYQYLHFNCPDHRLEALLNERGTDGWRLHTCEPFHVMIDASNWDTYFTVVMDKAYQTPAPAHSSNPLELDRSGAMACRG